MVSPKRALILHRKAGTPIKFDPERFLLNDRALDFTIEHAKRIKEWDALEKAVDSKIKQLHGFVNWWTRDVTPSGGGARRRGNGSVTPSISESQAKKLTGVGKMQKRRMVIRLKDPVEYRRYLLGVEYLAAHLADPDNFRALGTGNNEWHTPAKYIEMARAVLGEIDLDPASSEAAQHTVRAKKFFSLADNGLTKQWRGRVWLNPPYSAAEISAFVNKLCSELQAKRAHAAVLLTHNYTDSKWFKQAALLATAICFSSERVKFEDPNGIPCSPTQGQAFFYFGSEIARFAQHFLPIGFLVVPHNPVAVINGK